MKYAILVLAVLIAIAAVSVSRQTRQKQVQFTHVLDGSTVPVTADSVQSRSLHALRLSGNIEVRTKYVEVHADEATFNENTNEIEASGIVHIKLVDMH